jgi:hypothetical protein
MPPYQLCNVTNCAKSNLCYRYLAVPEENQLFHCYDTICTKDNEYYYFMKVRDDDKVIKLDSPAIKSTNTELDSTIEGETDAEQI